MTSSWTKYSQILTSLRKRTKTISRRLRSSLNHLLQRQLPIVSYINNQVGSRYQLQRTIRDFLFHPAESLPENLESQQRLLRSLKILIEHCRETPRQLKKVDIKASKTNIKSLPSTEQVVKGISRDLWINSTRILSSPEN